MLIALGYVICAMRWIYYNLHVYRWRRKILCGQHGLPTQTGEEKSMMALRVFGDNVVPSLSEMEWRSLKREIMSLSRSDAWPRRLRCWRPRHESATRVKYAHSWSSVEGGLALKPRSKSIRVRLDEKQNGNRTGGHLETEMWVDDKFGESDDFLKRLKKKHGLRTKTHSQAMSIAGMFDSASIEIKPGRVLVGQWIWQNLGNLINRKSSPTWEKKTYKFAIHHGTAWKEKKGLEAW